VSEPQKKFKLTHELRIVAASLLSLVVILVWAKFFGPKPPTVPLQGTVRRRRRLRLQARAPAIQLQLRRPVQEQQPPNVRQRVCPPPRRLQLRRRLIPKSAPWWSRMTCIGWNSQTAARW